MTSAPTYPPPDADSRPRPEASEATRYLCAAGHLSEKFAQAVVDELVHQPHRAVAPSHEISVGPVVRHCLAARRRSFARDGVVTVVLLLGILVASAQALSLGLGIALSLVALGLLVRGVRLLSDFQTGSGLVALVAAFVLSGPAFVLLLFSTAGSLTRGLPSLSPFDPTYDEYGDPVESLSLGWVPWLVALLVIWAAYFAYRLLVHHTIAVELAAGAFDPRRAPAVDRAEQQRLDYLEQAETGNVSIYSEDPGARPFVGYGEVVTTWTLTSQLVPADQMEDTSPFDEDGPTLVRGTSPSTSFTVHELYDAIRTGLVELADPRLHPDDALPHLTVRDRVFIAGRLPVDSPYLEQGRPRARLTGAEVRHFERAERGRSRHYQCVRMGAWRGELEVATFLHVSTRGRMLFVEFVATMMPGIQAAYHDIDTYDQLDLSAVLRALGWSLTDVVRAPVAFAAVLSAAGRRIRRAVEESAEEQRISRQLMFDYGCRLSVREMGADFRTQQRFQQLDAAERIKIVEGRLLPVLVAFLSDRGYDVGALVDQVTTVINNTTNSNTFNNSTLTGSPVVAGSSAQVRVPAAGVGGLPSGSGPRPPAGSS